LYRRAGDSGELKQAEFVWGTNGKPKVSIAGGHHEKKYFIHEINL